MDVTLPDEVFSAIMAPGTRVTSRVEIYESDGTTRWSTDPGNLLSDGTVTVDYSQDERRTVELTLDNSDGLLRSSPDGIWYDKIIKAYRGVIISRLPYSYWEVQIGEFMIDSVSQKNFPHTMGVNGRDYTKKCLSSKLAQAETITGPNTLESLIASISANAGITRKILPNTGISVAKTFTYEHGTDRWQIMKDIADAYSYDIFFDGAGYLRMETQSDAATTQPVFTLQTGPVIGNMASYEKSTNDSQLYNHILVIGAAEGDALPPWAEAINTDPTSPTRVSAIGDRLYEYDSEFITTTVQAQSVANQFLSVHALEQFSLSFDTLVFPNLEPGDIIEWVDPDPSPGDPTKFLLQSLTIPLGVGSMTGTAARILNVGS